MKENMVKMEEKVDCLKDDMAIVMALLEAMQQNN